MKEGCRLWSLFVAALFSAWVAPRAQADWSVRPVVSTHKLTAGAPGLLEFYRGANPQLQAARGEWVSIQLVVTADDLALPEVRLDGGDLSDPDDGPGCVITAAHLHFFRENYVLVARPSGNRRLQPLWWPDALIPFELQPSQRVEAHRSQVIWVAIQVPRATLPGNYAGRIAVTAGGEVQYVAVNLTVEPVDLPPSTLRANVAVYYELLRQWYKSNLPQWQDGDYADLKCRYYNFMLDYDLNAYDLPVSWQSPEAQTYLRDPRILSVRLPGLAGPDFAAALNSVQRAAAMDKAYYYWIDEPTPDRYPEIRRVTLELHRRNPQLHQCITAPPVPDLEGAVDIWCPNIGDFFGLGHLNLAQLARERASGRQTWWYTMVQPRYPYPTWLLDDDAAAVRDYGWMMARWGIGGFVYSMVHGWGPRPLENLQSFAGTSGDGTLLYPAELVGGHGPMPSVRLMLLREAIQDYNLLEKLTPAQREKLTAPFGSRPLRPSGDEQLWDSGALRERLFAALAGGTTTIMPPAETPAATTPPKFYITCATHSVRLDGSLGDPAWNPSTRFGGIWRRFDGDAGRPPYTQAWATYRNDDLLIAVRAYGVPGMRHPETIIVNIAPADCSERWRFEFDTRNKLAVIKATPEAHYLVEGMHWQATMKSYTDFYDVEIAIPLAVVDSATRFRLNLSRRVADSALRVNYLIHAAPDADDITLMPVATLQPGLLQRLAGADSGGRAQFKRANQYRFRLHRRRHYRF